LHYIPFASCKVQALKEVLVKAKSFKESNLPLLLRVVLYAKVLKATQVARIVAIAKIIIATYKLLAYINKVK